jgi:hypothetical protein
MGDLLSAPAIILFRVVGAWVHLPKGAIARRLEVAGWLRRSRPASALRALRADSSAAQTAGLPLYENAPAGRGTRAESASIPLSLYNTKQKTVFAL